MPTLLVVDDEPNVLYSVRKGLATEDLEVLTAATAREGIELVRQHAPDAMILDVRLTDMCGLDAFNRVREIDPRLPVIIITAYATTETAIEAMKRGAYEYLLKPVDFHRLREVVARAVELGRMRRVPALFDAPAAVQGEVDRIIGQGPAMQAVYKAIGRVAPQDVNVLILGENGTGKELVARAVYNHSTRLGAPFMTINCAAIPDALLESELFGHERGAFTGADRRRVGKFEQCDGGTLFLDEIGDMPLSLQAKILRLLQEQQFERLGSNDTVRADVRIIAATNQDLERRVAEGRFREDLYYRLKVFTIHLPALRHRMEDLPLLVDHFVKRFAEKLGKHVRAVAPEAMRRLEGHRWPGNVRELQSAVKCALVQAAGDVLTVDCLPDGLGTASVARRTDCLEPVVGLHDVKRHVEALLRAGDPDLYKKVSLAVDRVILETALHHAQGSQVQASELLGISRTTLRARLRALGLIRDRCSLTDPGHPDQKLSTA
ncbi:MAG: sigma-54 dependent transcriptional regulator [Gemmataceae bacterium]|nr:sigma-54 dependent transcriptional regulator [Gemmataceae bacterium]